jgi:hypothetical protein
VIGAFPAGLMFVAALFLVAGVYHFADLLLSDAFLAGEVSVWFQLDRAWAPLSLGVWLLIAAGVWCAPSRSFRRIREAAGWIELARGTLANGGPMTLVDDRIARAKRLLDEATQ